MTTYKQHRVNSFLRRLRDINRWAYRKIHPNGRQPVNESKQVLLNGQYVKSEPSAWIGERRWCLDLAILALCKIRRNISHSIRYSSGCKTLNGSYFESHDTKQRHRCINGMITPDMLYNRIVHTPSALRGYLQYFGKRLIGCLASEVAEQACRE